MAKIKKYTEKNTDRKTDKIYTAAVYARLSVDNHNSKNESINTQIEIAKAYLEQQKDIILHSCYTDLGKTGTNFDREGFNRMMQDIRLGRINCVIVKDFSRFGRNYIETGNYIDKIFPFLGVRFISVTDQYDSAATGAGRDTLEINLKNLVNDLYAKDISVKVKTSKQAKWEQGSYTGGIPPYGYRTQRKDDKIILLPEETTSEIVNQIYDIFQSGKSLKNIANWLFTKNVHRPKDYRKYGHVYRQEGEPLQEWSCETIKMMLKNPVYTGCLVHGQSVKKHTHRAVIDETVFLNAAERFEKRSFALNSRGYSEKERKTEALWKGLIFFEECKGPKSKSITSNTLTNLITIALKREILLSDITTKKVKRWNQDEIINKKQELIREKEDLIQKITDIKKKLSEQYLSYRNGEISQENFLKWKGIAQLRNSNLTEAIKQIESRLQKTASDAAQQEKTLKALLVHNDEPVLNRELITTFIRRITVYQDKRIEIMFVFPSVIMRRQMYGQ